MSTRSPAPGTAKAKFTLDRFELVDGERYEVEGRWSGVRGRLFLRPELTFTDRDGTHRLLADLAQKPWQASDEDAWAVAFPGGEAVDEAVRVELTVAPDLIVTLQRGRRRRSRRADADSAARPSSITATIASPPTAGGVDKQETKPSSGRRGLGVQLAEAQEQLEQARVEQIRLSERLDAALRRAETAHAETRQSAELRKELGAERDAAIAERDRAVAARDDAIQEREAAEAERDRVASARNALLVEHEGLAAERDAARHDADAAQRAAEQGTHAAQQAAQASGSQLRAQLTQAGERLADADGQLKRAQEALKTTTAERDAAVRAGMEVDRELQAARSEREMLLQERAALQRELDAPSPFAPEPPAFSEPEMPVTPPPPAPAPALKPIEIRTDNWQTGRTDPWIDSPQRRGGGPAYGTRAVAVGALALALLVIVLLLLLS